MTNRFEQPIALYWKDAEECEQLVEGLFRATEAYREAYKIYCERKELSKGVNNG